MKLNEWMLKKGLEPMEVSLGSGISLATIYRILRGAKTYRTTARKLKEFTEGEVILKELEYAESK